MSKINLYNSKSKETDHECVYTHKAISRLLSRNLADHARVGGKFKVLKETLPTKNAVPRKAILQKWT